MTHIYSQWYLGSFQDSFDEGFLSRNHINRIICVADEINISERPGRTFTKFPGLADDDSGGLLSVVVVPLLAHFERHPLLESDRVLVHCWDDQSRAPSILTVVLVKTGIFEDISSALEHIRNMGHVLDIFPPYYEQLAINASKDVP